jgi:hypothetical protein
MLKKQVKELITSYINFVDVYEVNISETKLERIKKVMYDFSNFVDEFVDEFVHDDEDNSYDDYNSTSSYYIMNDETGEFDEYDPSTFADEDDDYDGDEFDKQYEIEKSKSKHNIN